MDTTLETVEIFTRCTKASLWRIDNREKRLELVNFLGYPKEDRPFPYKALDETLQGWVVQNNRPYSVRMLKEYPDLYALDDRVTIMAYPLVLQNRPWGVVSIEAMPFERYNHYTEVVVNILLRLLEPGLQRLYELDLNFDQTEWDEVTGLPRYSLLVRNLTSQLTQALRNESSVSLIMVEMKNLSTDEDAKLSILRLADNLEQEMPGQHRMYHFKNDNQLGVVIPNLDENGTARLCLNLLSRISSLSGAPDVLIGYSCSVGHDNPTGATLIGEVERIVELQRV